MLAFKKKKRGRMNFLFWIEKYAFFFQTDHLPPPIPSFCFFFFLHTLSLNTMSYSPMDLDSSLDDLIKKRRQKQPKSTPPRKQPTNQTKHPKKQLSRPNIPIQSNKAKVSKPSTPQRTSGINARLVSSSAFLFSQDAFLFIRFHSLSLNPRVLYLLPRIIQRQN